jgi:hypothetical protein
MLIYPGTTYIGTLRATGVRHDPLALRIRLGHMLSAADLQPTGLPRHAIACIRRFRHPLPLWRRSLAGGIHPPLDWERAMATALDQLVRKAARPGQNAVPGNAEAVVFADYAELLACLASDWCAGEAAIHWWWQSILRGQDVSHAVRRAWREAPEYLPAALQHLAERGRAVRFAHALPSCEAYTLVQSITGRFALPELQAALEAGAQPGRERGGKVLMTDRPLQLVPQSASHAVPAAPPWQPWVPESMGHGLNFGQQCLLGVGLMLQRASGLVRAPSFALAVRRWSRAAQRPVEPPYPPLIELSEKAAVDTAFSPRLSPMGQVIQPLPAEQRAPEQQFADAIASTPPLSSSRGPGALDSPDLQIETDLGGLFYLINVGLSLNLYSDFTTPASPGIALPVWDFVTLVGQKLVGEEVHADPVWGLLVHLSGRGEQAGPGADFEPPDIWRLPVEWLAPFPEEAVCHWQGIDGRLQVRHPAQFLVLDVPLQPDDPARQLQCTLQDYGADLTVESQPEPVAANTSGTAPLARWLGWLMPYVRARLHRALQVLDADELAQILCTHHARVFVTATHVDITMALDALPIGVRLAGLDRDPGWVPAAGRFIAFHFE